MSGLDDFFSGGSMFDDPSFAIGDSFDISGFSDFAPMPDSVSGLDWMNGMKDPGPSGFWDSLGDQFSNIGKNAIKNPLGAIAAGLGAYGSYKESQGGGGGNTVNAVDKLMMKGDLANAWTPQPVKYGMPVARDPRRYMQSYDLDGNVTQNSANAGSVSDLYKQVLGRTPDAGGARFWENNMNTLGMTPAQLEMQLYGSPEAQVSRTFKGVLNRPADFESMNYWNQEVKNDPSRVHALRENLLAGPENAVNSLYREELGRNPDREGLEFWKGNMNGGMTSDQVRAALRASQEFANKPAPAPTAPTSGRVGPLTIMKYGEEQA